MGRWNSDAFLVYIRPQVLEFTYDLSHNMVRRADFRHADPNLPAPGSTSIGRDDPLLPRDRRALRTGGTPPAYASTTSFNGGSVVMPNLHLFH
jgi:hypothetical protein